MNVPLCEMYMDENIKKAVMDVLNSGIFINGPQVKAFEKEFASYIGSKYAVSVNSGTSALFISFMDMNLTPNDEVIVPSHTFIASASQAIHFGAKPIFAEANLENFTMDIDDVRKKITKKTRAIVAVHIYGHPVDMDPLLELAAEHSIKIIEDCAQSHGSRYKKRMTGSMGDYNCFSFFPSKIISVCGDGGMILTNNLESAKHMAMLKNHGRKEKYVHEIFGMNMRLPEIPATIGREQLKMFPKFISRRKEIVSRYNESFSQISQIHTQKTESWADPVYYAYVIRAQNRDSLAQFLKEKGIETGIHYPLPLHQQPIIKKSYGSQSLPITEQICREILTLPLSAAMTDDQIEYVIGSVRKFYIN